MNKLLKKIIAREGLIVLGCIVAFVIVLYSPFSNGNFMVLVTFLYPVTLLIRFIIWAVKTIKEKER